MTETNDERAEKFLRDAEEYSKRTDNIIAGVIIVFFLTLILPLPMEVRVVIGFLGGLIILSR